MFDSLLIMFFLAGKGVGAWLFLLRSFSSLTMYLGFFICWEGGGFLETWERLLFFYLSWTLLSSSSLELAITILALPFRGSISSLASLSSFDTASPPPFFSYFTRSA